MIEGRAVSRTSNWSVNVGRWVVIFLVICVGFVARLYIATLGFNGDLESMRIVARVVDAGKNVYAETTRYNYTYVWALIVGALYEGAKLGSWLTGLSADTFLRYAIAAFLSFVDIDIFIFLTTRFNLKAGLLFYLNPVSIIITGYHSQFDNLAILLCLLAVDRIGKIDATPWEKLAGSSLLGLSLMTKHIFFLLPFWLAIKQKTWKERLLVLGLPPILFLLAFLPFWSEAGPVIMRTVFLYRSFNNAPIYGLLAPPLVVSAISSFWFFIFALVAGGIFFRSESALVSTLAYSILLVIVSPAIANQYLTIPLAAIAADINIFYLAYSALSTWLLMGDGAGLGIAQLRNSAPAMFVFGPTSLQQWDSMAFALLVGFMWSLKGGQIRAFAREQWNIRRPTWRARFSAYVWIGMASLLGVLLASGLHSTLTAELSQPNSNLALDSKATQSSMYYDLAAPPAQLAVDDNTDGNFYHGSVSHTNKDFQAWWEADLGKIYMLESIQIYNRTDCCKERLADFVVMISDTPFQSNDLAVMLLAGYVSKYKVGQADPVTTISLNRTGRYVRVQLTGENYLSLAEVRVWGRPWTALDILKMR